MRSNEPLTAGGRELRLKARPPARLTPLMTPRMDEQFRPLKSPDNCLDNGEHLILTCFQVECNYPWPR